MTNYEIFRSGFFRNGRKEPNLVIGIGGKKYIVDSDVGNCQNSAAGGGEKLAKEEDDEAIDRKKG